MSGYDEMVRQLRMAVYGNEHDSVEASEQSWEDLLWEVGNFRRRSEDAHSYLDVLDAPRTTGSDEGVLTTRGRLLTIRGRLEELMRKTRGY